jgi:hypothetical protein
MILSLDKNWRIIFLLLLGFEPVLMEIIDK